MKLLVLISFLWGFPFPAQAGDLEKLDVSAAGISGVVDVKTPVMAAPPEPAPPEPAPPAHEGRQALARSADPCVYQAFPRPFKTAGRVVKSAAQVQWNEQSSGQKMQAGYSQARDIVSKAIANPVSQGPMVLPSGDTTMIGRILKSFLAMPENVDNTAIKYSNPSAYRRCSTILDNGLRPVGYAENGNIYVCEIYDPERTAQFLVHEFAHTAGIDDECDATMVESYTMLLAGIYPASTGYSGQCPKVAETLGDYFSDIYRQVPLASELKEGTTIKLEGVLAAKINKDGARGAVSIDSQHVVCIFNKGAITGRTAAAAVEFASADFQGHPTNSLTKVGLLLDSQPVTLNCYTPDELPLTVSQLWSLGFQVEGYQGSQLELFGGARSWDW